MEQSMTESMHKEDIMSMLKFMPTIDTEFMKAFQGNVVRTECGKKCRTNDSLLEKAAYC